MTEQHPGSSSSGLPAPALTGTPGPAPTAPGSAQPAAEPVADARVEPAESLGQGRASLADLVDQPAKVMRIGTMLKQLLEEVRSAPLDDAARTRLAEIHERSVKELEDGLAPELVQELHRINLPFEEDAVPSDAELRVAQAQLVGWLEGLFHGIQAALAAQQVANQQLAAKLQLRQLPPGTVLAPGVVVGEDGEPVREPGKRDQAQPEHRGPGQYL